MPLPSALIAKVRPATYDLVVVRGDSLQLDLRPLIEGVPQDLTAVSAQAAVIRTDYAIGTSLLVLTVAVVAPATDGILRVTATPAQTSGLTVPGGTPDSTREVTIGVWDLQISDGTNTVTVAVGNVILIRDRTP